jgi:hypothetical protein
VHWISTAIDFGCFNAFAMNIITSGSYSINTRSGSVGFCCGRAKSAITHLFAKCNFNVVAAKHLTNIMTVNICVVTTFDVTQDTH